MLPQTVLRHPAAVAALALVFLVLVFLTVVRPWYLTWGTTAADQTRALPGDDLVPHATGQTTRGVLIHAPAKDVWPWLVQAGYHRAGWYNLDWVNRLLGAADYVDGHRSADRIIPELQDLKVGDRIPFAPKQEWTVVALEPERSLVLKGDGVTFTFILEPVDATTTRLLSRFRSVMPSGAVKAIFAVLEPGIFLQDSRFLLGVKKRAERLANERKGVGK